MVTNLQARLHDINTRLEAELANHARLHAALGKAIVLISLVTLFGAFCIADGWMRRDDLRHQGAHAYVAR